MCLPLQRARNCLSGMKNRGVFISFFFIIGYAVGHVPAFDGMRSVCVPRHNHRCGAAHRLPVGGRKKIESGLFGQNTQPAYTDILDRNECFMQRTRHREKRKESEVADSTEGSSLELPTSPPPSSSSMSHTNEVPESQGYRELVLIFDAPALTSSPGRLADIPEDFDMVSSNTRRP